MNNLKTLTEKELSVLNTNVSNRVDYIIANIPIGIGEKKYNTGRKPDSFTNKYKEVLQQEWTGAKIDLSIYREDTKDTSPFNTFLHEEIDDVVVGISRLDFNESRITPDKPLSISKIMDIYSTLDEVSVRSISNLLSVSDTTAKRYYRATKLGYRYLSKSQYLKQQLIDLEAVNRGY